VFSGVVWSTIARLCIESFDIVTHLFVQSPIRSYLEWTTDAIVAKPNRLYHLLLPSLEASKEELSHSFGALSNPNAADRFS
jgi:hypothetical protein